MPNWSEVLKEIDGVQESISRQSSLDIVRRKYLKRLFNLTHRNVIAYYSGFLQKPRYEDCIINDNDKNGFMTAIHQLDRSLGLDLLIHTPGGSTASVESLVDYLHKMFDRNIRAFIPQTAMSAGTMLACACKEIVMGKHSNLGPIDPQFGGIPASGVIEEFETAKEQIKKDPSCIPLWQVIIGKYHPAFIGDCVKAISWSKDMVRSWLENVMFYGDCNAKQISLSIVDHLCDHAHHKSHDRHITIDDCKNINLKVIELESLDKKLRDTVLTIHHSFMHTFGHSQTAIKIIENHRGIAMVNHISRP